MTQVAIDTTTRAVLALGQGLGTDPTRTIVEPTDAVLAAIEAALLTVVGDGYVTLAADLVTVAVQPPSAASQAALAAQTALTGYIQQHRQALANLYSQIATQNAGFGADLTQAGQIIQAWIGGTAPSQAQALTLIKVIIRVLVLEHSSVGA